MKRIFITVGTHPQQFNRLLQELDNLSRDGKLKESVFAQTGHSTYVPKHFQHTQFLGLLTFQQKIKEADIVITHGGEGSIGEALQQNKKMIMVPRLKKFGEHTNDHQLELVDAVVGEKRAVAVYDISQLGKALDEMKNFVPKSHTGNKGIVKILEHFVEENFHA